MLPVTFTCSTSCKFRFSQPAAAFSKIEYNRPGVVNSLPAAESRMRRIDMKASPVEPSSCTVARHSAGRRNWNRLRWAISKVQRFVTAPESNIRPCRGTTSGKLSAQRARTELPRRVNIAATFVVTVTSPIH